jgi:hypothetical protein
VLVVPINDESDLAFKVGLILGDHDPSQDLFHRFVKSLDYGDASVLADRSESRPDVSYFAPVVLEVLAFELRALINNQMFGSHVLSGHDAIQCRSDVSRLPSVGT